MDFTVFGMLNDDRLMQLLNIPSSTVSIPSGMVTDTKLEQSENAPIPIDFTPFGIVTVVRALQLENALNIENQRFTF